MITHKMKPVQRYNSSARKASRPWSVTLLALVVLTIATLNLVRCWQALSQWRFLSEILPISPLYLVLSGLIWVIAGLPAFWGLWTGGRWAPGMMRYSASAYSVYYWVDRLLVKKDADEGTIAFTLIINLAILGIVYWILIRKKAVAFFGETYD